MAHFEGLFIPSPVNGYSTIDNELSGRICASDSLRGAVANARHVRGGVFARGAQVGPTITDEGTGPVTLVSGAEAHCALVRGGLVLGTADGPAPDGNPRGSLALGGRPRSVRVAHERSGRRRPALPGGQLMVFPGLILEMRFHVYSTQRTGQRAPFGGS